MTYFLKDHHLAFNITWSQNDQLGGGCNRPVVREWRLDQGDSSESNELWYIVKVSPGEFASGLGVKCKRVVKDDVKIFA